MKLLGQIRVDRGSGDSAPLQQAIDALQRGEAIGIFPQGTIPRGEAFYDPNLRAKTGVARLAVAADVPVVPVALWDTEKIWPRNSRLPHVGELLARRPVYMKVGEPMHLKLPPGSEDDAAAYHELADQVMEAIAALLPDEVRNPPRPTAEQVKRASPSGAKEPPADA
jgi:putative phosphoserine phosphatase/1-acylglycerol-3-phosphate O-acyltransferase